MDFENILKELEFRVPNGIVDLTKDSQVTILSELLRQNGDTDAFETAQKVRVYFSYLQEVTKAKPKKTPLKPGESPTYPGYYRIGGNYYSKTPGGEITHSSDDGTMKPLNKKEKADANAQIKSKKEKSTQEPKGTPVFGGGKKSKPKTITEYTSETGIDDMISVDGNSFDGYRTGKTVAAGTAPGAFPEVCGMLGAGFLRQNPNATDEEIAKYLGDWASKGKVTKNSKVSGGDKMTAAVHTARVIYNATNEIATEEGYNPKTTKVEGYWGSDDSKNNAIKRVKEIVQNNPKATFNGLSADEYIQIIKENGAGENPTDSMVLIWDGKSNNVSFLHISNKVGSNNIQANSTVKETFNRSTRYIETSTLPDTDKQKAINSIKIREKNITKLQKEQKDYQTSFLPKFVKLTSNPKILKEMTKDIYDEEGIVHRGKKVDALFIGKGGIAKACKKISHAACKLVGKASKPEDKVKAMFQFYKDHPELAPASVREVISRVCSLKNKDKKAKYNIGYDSRVINQIYGKMNDEVEKMRQDINKVKSGLGDRMLAHDFAARLHLTLSEGHNPGGIPHNRFKLIMGNNEADIWYDKSGQAYQKNKDGYHKVKDDGSLEDTTTELKQKDISRGNIATVGDEDNFKTCLGVPTGKSIEEYTNVKYEKINTETGIQKAHIFDVNGREIGIMVIRTKSGPGGDANDTLQFSKDMQNCMQRQEYIKRKKKNK